MFSSAYKRYALAAMTTVYTLHLVDRGLIAILLQPIKEELRLSDTQLGLVTGIAFGLFYATLGLPIARWADRGNRVSITALAIGSWGLTMMACLFVTNYLQLLLARIAAAVGEAGCKPPTYSLVGDYFPQPAERTRAMAVYITAGPMSALVSYVLAGWLNELYGWRLTFFLAGIPGLILAAVVKWTLVEPRTLAQRACIQHRAAPPMKAVLAVLRRQRAFKHLTIALILLFTLSAGLGPWYAAVMIRSHGMSTAELGVWMGLIFGLSAIAGSLLGGFVVARWLAGNERVQMRLASIGILLFLPFAMAFLLLPGRYQALASLVPMMLVSTAFLAPVYSLMQRLVADDMRATTFAMVMLLANLVGMGFGPLAVGTLSDALTPRLGHEALRYAMLIVSLGVIWAAYHFWAAGRTVGEDLAAAAARRSVAQ